MPPAPSVRINTVRPSWPPWAAHGNCANASADHADVIGGGVGPSISRPEQERQRFPGVPGTGLHPDRVGYLIAFARNLQLFGL